MTTHSQMREFGPCCSRTACSGDIRDGAAPEHTCACHEHYGEGRCIYGEADNANYAKVEELFPGFQHALRAAGYEITAQIARARRWRIYEVGISYYGRTYDEGKKINWLDGLKALMYLFKFRIRSQ